jgi:hypothetical protein
MVSEAYRVEALWVKQKREPVAPVCSVSDAVETIRMFG